MAVQNDSEFYIETEYQWYRNAENSIDGGQKNFRSNKKAPIHQRYKENGTTYYFCKIRAVLTGNAGGKGFDIYSDEITTDVVSVIVTDAPFASMGGERETEGSPYLIKNNFRYRRSGDKVNKEGIFF